MRNKIWVTTTVSFSLSGMMMAIKPTKTEAFVHNNVFTERTRIKSKRLDSLHSTDDDFDLSEVRVMVNGMPGPMATAAAEACLRKGLKLSPAAMTGPDQEPMTITVVDEDTGNSANVRLIPSDQSDEIDSAYAGMVEACGPNNLLAVDYTHPSAVAGNGRWYAKVGLPFVMGTTGGDRDALTDAVNGVVPAVIAPNMGKQIVAMQAALAALSKDFPGSFAGYRLEVTESHQATKADTSGTARAVVADLQALSGPSSNFDVDSDIVKLRTDSESTEFGVKPDHLKGHAFHTYTMTSPDGSVEFVLKHNVSGRRIYAEGTADAVKFLARRLRDPDNQTKAKIYDMIDVLKEGALE